MDSKNIIEEIRQIDWSKYSGQEYYFPDKVPQSLINLVTMTNDDSFSDIYHDVLSTIGNDHAGTYYPATMDAIKFIVWTSLNGKTDTARFTATEITIALYATFDSSTEKYNILTAKELRRKVNSLIEASKDKFKAQRNTSHETEKNKDSLADLLDCIDEQTKFADT